MADLQGSVGELTFNLEIKSAETGEVRKVQLVGIIGEAEAEQLQADGIIPTQPQE